MSAVAARTALCRVIRADANCWSGNYGTALAAIARGLLDGTLTGALLTAYPLGTYPDNLSRAIASQVGLPFYADGPQYNDHGWRIDVDTEEVDAAIAMLRGVPDGLAGINGGPSDDGREAPWSFYPDILDGHGLTIDEARTVMRQHATLADAARLVVDAFEVPLHDAIVF